MLKNCYQLKTPVEIYKNYQIESHYSYITLINELKSYTTCYILSRVTCNL